MALGSRFPPLMEVRLRCDSPGADRNWGAPCLPCAWDAGRLGDKVCPSRIRLGLFLLSFQTPLRVHPGVHSLHVNLPSRDQAWWQDLALIIRG